VRKLEEVWCAAAAAALVPLLEMEGPTLLAKIGCAAQRCAHRDEITEAARHIVIISHSTIYCLLLTTVLCFNVVTLIYSWLSPYLLQSIKTCKTTTNANLREGFLHRISYIKTRTLFWPSVLGRTRQAR